MKSARAKRKRAAQRVERAIRSPFTKQEDKTSFPKKTNPMKKSLIPLATIIGLLSTKIAYANCYLNDKEIPCDQMPNWFWPIIIILPIVIIVCIVFWIIMLIDVLKTQKEKQLSYVILLVFLNFIGAIIYYAVEKRKTPSKSKNN